MPTDGKKRLRSSTGKSVKNISDKKNAAILKSRRSGSGPKRSTAGYTGSGRKTGRSQYVTRVKSVKSKGLKSTGTKKVKTSIKAKTLKKKK